MATVNKIQIVVEAEDKATAPISKATEATKKLGKESKKVSKDSKKDWGGLGDLFSGLLPRSLQKMSRGFKGTQRQVGRLSKSFKVLKAAWAAVGIGALIIAIELLIENFDYLRDSIMGVTQAQKDRNKIEEAGINATRDATSELDVYRNVLNDTTASEVARKDALVKLAQATGLLEGIDINDPEDAEKVNKAYEDYLDNVEKQAEFDQATLLIKQKKKLLDEDEAKNLDAIQKGQVYAMSLINPIKAWNLRKQLQLENQARVESELVQLQQQQADFQKDAAASQDEITKAIIKQQEAAKKLAKEKADAKKRADKVKRDAEAAEKKRLQQQKADAEWLANQRITIAQQTELRLIQDEEQRQIRSLEIQHETAKEELKARGGTLTDLLELEQKFEMDKEVITNDFKERAKEKDKIEKEKEKQDKATLKAALATDQENEILQVQERYAKLQELAEADSEESKQLTEKSRLEIEAINKKFNDKEIAENEKVQALKKQAVGKMVNSVSGLLGNLSDLAEENSEQQKRLAVVDILINQSVAMANAIAGAAKASKETGPAAPFTFAAYVATMLGTIAGTFASIKAVMNEAGASGGGSIGGGSRGGGGGGSQATLPLPARLDSPSNLNQAYVVQSQLQGQQMSQNRLNNQIIL